MDRRSRCMIVGVAGASASGKTSACRVIQKMLANLGVESFIISQDWFYHELSAGTDGDTYNWDAPEAFDNRLLVTLLIALKDPLSQNQLWAPDHDYSAYKVIPKAHPIPKVPVYLVEGIMVLQSSIIRPLLDLKLYIECDRETAFARRVIRDINERHYTLPLIIERYKKYVAPAFLTHIEPSRSYADLIIVNNGDKGLADHRGLRAVVNGILVDIQS